GSLEEMRSQAEPGNEDKHATTFDLRPNLTMFLLRTFQLGMKSLLLHPMRSLLTVLGIFIGVASVIWLLAICEGISQEAQRQIEGLGADNILIRSIKPPSDVLGSSDAPIPYGLRREEFDMLVETIPTIKA